MHCNCTVIICSLQVVSGTPNQRGRLNCLSGDVTDLPRPPERPASVTQGSFDGESSRLLALIPNVRRCSYVGRSLPSICVESAEATVPGPL